MANPVFGEGTILEVNDGAASAFVAIDDVTNVDPPDAAAIEVERNRLSVTTMKERAFSTRLDPGMLQFTYEADYTKVARIELLKNVDKSWRLTLTDGLRMAFTGRLMTNDVQGVQGEQVNSAQCSVRLTSLITLPDPPP